MKIYTRSGDEGETGLFGGGRVPKSHIRVEAYGAVEELNAALGVAVAAVADEEIQANLESVQQDLFNLGSSLATPALSVFPELTNQIATEIPLYLAQFQNFFGRQGIQELFLVILPFKLQLFIF